MRIPVAAAICLLTVASCDNSLYRLENLYPDKYKKIVSFQDDAVNTTDIIKLYDINIDITETLTLLRGGSDPSLPATVRMRGMTGEEAEIYVQDGIVIDPQFYTIPEPEIVFANDERYKKVNIEFSAEDIAGIKETMKRYPESSFYIALIIDGFDGTEVSESRFYYIREITLGKPTITLTGSSVKENKDFWSVELSASMDGNNIWDFDCNLFCDNSYVDDYNNSVGKDYDQLPESSVVTFSNEGRLSFRKGDAHSQNTVTLTISKDGFNLDNAPYVLPIMMNYGDFDFELYSPYYMIIEGLITLTADMLSCPFDISDYDGGGLAALVDGDIATFWHTPYRVDDGYEYYFDEKYGHYFDINIGRQISQIKCKYCNRYNSNDPTIMNRWAKDIELYISSDGEEWTLLESFEAPADEREVELGPVFSETPFSHLRFSIRTTQNGDRLGIDEASCTHMSEFYLYGV